MAKAYAAQDAVIEAFHEIGEVDLADRLERCMTARRERRGGDGSTLSSLDELHQRLATVTPHSPRRPSPQWHPL